MPYTTLGSATAGDVYTAAAHNAIIGNLNSLGPAAFNVQSTLKTDTFSTTNNTFTDVTGLSVAITPSSATSKVLVIANLGVSQNFNFTDTFIKILRGSSDVIAIGDAAGSRRRMYTTGMVPKRDYVTQVVLSYLDSPASTSAQTYKIQIASRSTGGDSVHVNRGDVDTDSTAYGRYASSITVIEVPV